MHVQRMTLTETCLALTLIGILGSAAVPSARHGLAVVQVRAAREAVFGAAMRTRAVAIAQGGAELIVDTTEKTALVVNAAGAVIHTTALTSHRVELIADASSSRVIIRYDARGIGRMASRTLRFRRGDVEAGLTISSYGRVRRW
jgi:type II secretory pathway pseudopilin PulG